MSEAHEKSEKTHGHGGGHGAPHGGHEEAHEGAPEWLISFADNVTLMMGFFVILFAMNLAKPVSGGMGGDAKDGGTQLTPEMLDAIIAIREAFNNPVDPSSTNPIDLPLVRRLMERGDSQAEREGQIGREHDIRSIRPSDYYSIAGMIPFSEDATSFHERGEEALRQILGQMKGHNLVIEVRGHASAAEAFRLPDRGMQLSYERARAVAARLTAEGVPWTQLRLIGCADGERLMSVAYDTRGHEANQRVELIVTDRIFKPAATEQP